MLVIIKFITIFEVKILTTINWELDKLLEYVKPKTKRHKRKIDYVFNLGNFFRIEGCDLVNIKYLTELFIPYLTESKETIVIDVSDYCDYNWQSREPIKEYRIRYKIYINGICKYKFDEYFIYRYLPVNGVIFQKIKIESGEQRFENLLISMWNEGLIEVNGNDAILGYAVRTSLEFKSAQSLSICKECCHYQHHSYGWLRSNDIFCEVHPARASYNLVECPSFNKPDAAKQKPLCYDCKYFNQERPYSSKHYIGCAVHPEHKKYDLMECRDYSPHLQLD
jgi:hypothetical protein